jgi:hypothetical protein
MPMFTRSISRLAGGIGPRPRMSQYGPTIGGAGGQTMIRLGYRAFAVATLVAGVWFIGVVPAVTDSISYLRNKVGFLRKDPDEMD